MYVNYNSYNKQTLKLLSASTKITDTVMHLNYNSYNKQILKYPLVETL